MKPKLCTDRTPLQSPRTTCDASSSRPSRRQSMRKGSIFTGTTLPTGQARQSSKQIAQRTNCKASKTFVVYAGVQTSVATRLVVPDLKLQFGERIKCVGQSAELGSWYLNAAPILSWTEGDTWVHHLQLPTGNHEFKLLITRDDGTTHWEGGPNRTIEVPERINGILEVKCTFEQTEATELGTVPRPIKDQDLRAIRAAQAGHDAESSSHNFRNDIFAGDVPDAMEGDSTEREPDNLGEAKKWPGLDRDRKRDEKPDEEALEGVSPPSSDPLKETEPSPDDRNVQSPTNYSRYSNNYSQRSYNNNNNNNYSRGSVFPRSQSHGNNGNGNGYGGETRAWGTNHMNNGFSNGAPKNGVELNGAEIKKIKKNFELNGQPVEMYGGAEAKELDDGSVLVKFPPDDNGEDILKLVQRLLGYYEPK